MKNHDFKHKEMYVKRVNVTTFTCQDCCLKSESNCLEILKQNEQKRCFPEQMMDEIYSIFKEVNEDGTNIKKTI